MDVDKCIACGMCAEKCPKKVSDEYNEGLAQRKAIYVPYSQAVPLKYTIDGKNCIYLEKGKCGACEKYCPSGAINFNDVERTLTLHVGSIILAPGFKSFDPSRFDHYAWANLPDVVTALEFERVLSATGPYSGHLVRPSSKRMKNQPVTYPQRIAWLQCVGSRDLNRCDNGYCSSVCCMYAVKQAVMAKDHSETPLECAIFYMDMRTPGKDFDRYYENARDQGVRFVPSRVHTIAQVPASDDLMLRYVDEHGKVNEEIFDIVVLSTGIEISRDTVDLANRLGIELDRYHFTRCDSFHPVSTSIPGIYACGAFTGPKDIPQSVMEASAAACAATEKLASARHTCTRAVAIPPERNVARALPKIGVFVCNCGINIGGIVRVPEVAEYAATLPGVVYVEENLFTCSQDTQVKLSEVIREKGLNRVVIAACTPRTHETLFQETLVNAGLNKYLVEMANIRNQDSWVHSDDPDEATQKAKDLVRMAVAKVTFSKPLLETDLPIKRSALIVGGGVAGMTAALSIARQGFPVHLVEKSSELGGNARQLGKTYRGEPIQRHLNNLVTDVQSDNRITIYQETTVAQVDGFVGNFKSTLTNGQSSLTVEHGVAILAHGAREYQPKEYLYGEHAAVVTQLELDVMLKDDHPALKRCKNIVFIQCVGSRNEERPYCSRVCCTHSLNAALELKERHTDINAYVLYRDIRTYGQREELYQRARERGVLFFRYEPDDPPVLTPADEQLMVTFEDSIIGRRLCVHADILCLASAIESHHDHLLARNFKISMDTDGWLLEAHQKLRPVEFASEGIFLCGMAHYPKPIEESIAQAQAAASRAMTVLARESIKVGGIVARIEAELCSGCLGCINVCPFTAITFNHEKKIAEVNPALCKGCGACAAACPSEAPMLMGFSNKQMYAQIKSAVNM